MKLQTNVAAVVSHVSRMHISAGTHERLAPTQFDKDILQPRYTGPVAAILRFSKFPRSKVLSKDHGLFV